MKFRIPHKALLINLSILIIIILEGMFITQPSLATINDIKEDIQEQHAEVNRQLALGQTTKKVLEDLEAIKPFLKQISGFFLKKDDQLVFITTLEELAAKNNMIIKIQLSDIPEDDETSSGDVLAIPLSLSLEGSYIDTMRFLVELQTLAFYVNVTNLSMNAQGEENPAITTSLRANTYWTQ